MNQLTLQQIFGVNVFQDGQVLRINKSDLPLLTPSAENSAESLLIAILLKSLENFQGKINDENGEPITDEYNNSFTFDNSNQFELLSVFVFNSYLLERNSNLHVVHNIVIHDYAPN
jgi:hypothetical protein